MVLNAVREFTADEIVPDPSHSSEPFNLRALLIIQNKLDPQFIAFLKIMGFPGCKVDTPHTKILDMHSVSVFAFGKLGIIAFYKGLLAAVFSEFQENAETLLAGTPYLHGT
jgi:hypothetical protein